MSSKRHYQDRHFWLDGAGRSQAKVTDVLVYFSEPKSLLNVVALERQISKSLGRKVDLLTEAAISPYLRDKIKQELVVIYEAR